MLRVTTRWTGVQGTPYWSTHYFGGVTEADATAAAAAVVNFWQDCAQVIVNLLTPTIQPEVELVETATGQTSGVFTVPTDEAPPTASGTPLPWANQGLLRWRTGVFIGGREIRGRTFIPGPTEDNNTQGDVPPGYTNITNLAASNLITAGAGAGSLVVYSRTHAQAAVVQSASTWDQWAVTRSRRD